MSAPPLNPGEIAPEVPMGVQRLTLLTLGAAVVALGYSVCTWESPDIIKFGIILLLATLSAGMQVSLPSSSGSLPLTMLFVLVGILDLTTQETILLAATAAGARYLWYPRVEQPRYQTLMPIALTIVAAGVGIRLFHSEWLMHFNSDAAARLGVATLGLFLTATVPDAMVTAMLDGEAFVGVWRERYLPSLPYYLGGAIVAQMTYWANRYLGWQTVMLTVPVVYLIYRSYRLYLERLEDGRRHAEEMSSLHLRTIEALALAIEAKDHTTHDHLQRVQTYAVEMAKDLGLVHDEQEALRAAALLHDIGKLAVPEHIISKPGRLTPEEFEKMKIHPVVGAEILERVRFPYPVAPIVRAHHEKWDGSGYPYGLSGENIPMGARILAAVDCLDALATDRQYRRAIPLPAAMKVVESESGKAFDPKVVEILSRRYVELEQKAQSAGNKAAKRAAQVQQMRRDVAPAAGFETAAPSTSKDSAGDFLTSIAEARHEVQALFEISQDLGNSLSLDETLSVLGVRLRRIIPHHALAIWIRREDRLIPQYVNGEDYRMFASLEVPVGQGLSGWVAENSKPVLNGNPSVEPGYLNDPTKFSTLRSALAVPLEGGGGVLGVLSLYHLDGDAFTKDHLRILLGIGPKLGMSIENAIRFQQAASSATTDFLTSLPNARSLFLHLDSEVSRGRRENLPLAVLVIDLDGFKQVNDRMGHLEGNKTLKSVGAALKAVCREYDYVARMGGDEFVVILPGAAPTDVEGRLAYFREVVGNAGPSPLTGIEVGASIGVAHFPRDGSDAETLLAEADRRMYQEKRIRKAAARQPAVEAPTWLRDGASAVVIQ